MRYQVYTFLNVSELDFISKVSFLGEGHFVTKEAAVLLCRANDLRDTAVQAFELQVPPPVGGTSYLLFSSLQFPPPQLPPPRPGGFTLDWILFIA